MISPAHSDLAFTLTNYYFDENIANILKTLFKYDQLSLKFLRYCLPQIKFSQLKKSLLVLVKYQLVDFVSSYKNGIELIEYSIVPRRVFSFFRISRYIHKMKARDNDPIAAILLIILSERALVGRDQLIKIAKERVKSKLMVKFENEENLENTISSKLESLITTGYLAYQKDICIKIERLDRDHRDDLITDTICDYYQNDSKIKSICKMMLEISRDNTSNDATITAPVPYTNLEINLVPSAFENKAKLEAYLSKLVRENNNRFFLTCGTHSNKGIMYAVNVGLAIDYLVKEHLTSMITTRFGPKCCRVFRVLLQKGPLLLKQIEEIIMLPARDVREYTYMLIKENFIRNRQVPKTPDNAPGKSVFIMSVDLDQVVFRATDLCCRSINNLLIRYKFELERNKVLLDRAKAVQELLGDLKDNNADSLEEWSQYFNSHELAELHQINRILDKLLKTKHQVDETLFLFHSWLDVRPNLEVDDTG